jgi:hypothetical protein
MSWYDINHHVGRYAALNVHVAMRLIHLNVMGKKFTTYLKHALSASLRLWLWKPDVR